MMLRSAGRNGACVRVGIKVCVGVAIGVAEGTGETVDVGVAGTGLELGIEVWGLLSKLSDVEAGSLAGN